MWERHAVPAERGGCKINPPNTSSGAQQGGTGAEEAAGPAGWEEEAAPWRPGENGCAASSSCWAVLGCEDSPWVPNTQNVFVPGPWGCSAGRSPPCRAEAVPGRRPQREDIANTILGKMKKKKRVGGDEKEEEETTQTMKENRILCERWERWKGARKEA